MAVADGEAAEQGHAAASPRAGGDRRGRPGWRMRLLLLRRGLLACRRRATLAVLAISVGASLVVALSSVYLDISIKMSRELRTFGANFYLGPAEDRDGATLPQDEVTRALAAVPTANRIAGSAFLYGTVRLDLGEVVLVGADLPALHRLMPYWQVQGRWINVDFDDRHVMVGRRLADNMHLQAGQTVNVILANGERRSFQIKAVVETGDAHDGHLFVNLPVAQALLGRSGEVDHVLASIDGSGLDIPDLVRRIEATAPGVHARPILRISAAEGTVLQAIDGLMAGVTVIVLAIVTLCVNAILTAMVADRQAEIGLKKALGADDRRIALEFALETMVLAALAAAAGLVGGLLLAQALGQAMFASWIAFRPLVVPLSLGVILVTALAAAALPIRRATRLAPAVVLKGE